MWFKHYLSRFRGKWVILDSEWSNECIFETIYTYMAIYLYTVFKDQDFCIFCIDRRPCYQCRSGFRMPVLSILVLYIMYSYTVEN